MSPIAAIATTTNVLCRFIVFFLPRLDCRARKSQRSRLLESTRRDHDLAARPLMRVNSHAAMGAEAPCAPSVKKRVVRSVSHCGGSFDQCRLDFACRPPVTIDAPISTNATPKRGFEGSAGRQQAIAGLGHRLTRQAARRRGRGDGRAEAEQEHGLRPPLVSLWPGSPAARRRRASVRRKGSTPARATRRCRTGRGGPEAEKPASFRSAQWPMGPAARREAAPGAKARSARTPTTIMSVAATTRKTSASIPIAKSDRGRKQADDHEKRSQAPAPRRAARSDARRAAEPMMIGRQGQHAGRERRKHSRQVG